MIENVICNRKFVLEGGFLAIVIIGIFELLNPRAEHKRLFSVDDTFITSLNL